MGGKSPPSAPDPYQAAAAQYQYGTAAANYSAGLNRPGIETPYGSTTWSTSPQPAGPGYTATPSAVPNPSGYTGAFYGGPPNMQAQPVSPGVHPARETGPGGGAVPPTAPAGNLPVWLGGGGGRGGAGGYAPPGYAPTLPSGAGAPEQSPPNYTEAITLSPAEQALFNLNQGGELGIGARSAAAAADGGYATSVPGVSSIPEFTDEARRAAFEQQTQYLDPQFSQEQEQLDASLRNSGAYPGSPAYNNAMTLFNNKRQQAYTNAFDNSVGAGLNEQQALFGEGVQGGEFGNASILAGLNETGFGGAPSFGLGGGGGGGGGSVAAPDLMAAFQNQYASQLAGYNSQVAQSNADIGALGTIAAAFASNPELWASA